MSSMRKILASNFQAIFRFLKIKSDSNNGPVCVSWSPNKQQNDTYFFKMIGEIVFSFCDEQFSTDTLLNDRNHDVHTQVESPCNLCDKSFRSKKKLRYHITSTHAEKEAFQCDIKSVGIQ